MCSIFVYICSITYTNVTWQSTGSTLVTHAHKRAGGRNRTRPGGRNRTRNVRSSFTTGGRNRTRMCQKRDRRGTLERVETEREGVKTERGVHFLWQAQACGSVTCKEMVRYYFTFYYMYMWQAGHVGGSNPNAGGQRRMCGPFLVAGAALHGSVILERVETECWGVNAEPCLVAGAARFTMSSGVLLCV